MAEPPPKGEVRGTPRYVGPYRVENRLGRGGMGEVHRAYDSRLDRYVALKQIRGAAVHQNRSRRRLLREARSAAKLNHPTIVQVHDILEVEGSDWIVMELVEGTSLEDALKQGPFRLEIALSFAAQLASGLAAAHARGIVHRDLKSENIILTSDGRPKILDFGLAKDLVPDDESSLSRQGQLIGTPRAMSPEQAKGKGVDHRADLFALGGLLYEMLTRQSPFDASTALRSLEKVCSHEPLPPSRLVAVPPEVDDLVRDLLAKDPDERPTSADEVHERLRRILVQLTGDDEISDLGLIPPPPAGGGRSRNWWHPGGFGGVGILLLTMLGALGLWWLWSPAPEDKIVIGVLPFTHRGDESFKFFAAGLEEKIVEHLSRVESLEVVRLVSEEAALRGDPGPGRRGAEDEIDYILTGGAEWYPLEKATKVRIRIGLELPEDPVVVWSEIFDRSADDPFRIQDEISSRLLTILGRELGFTTGPWTEEQILDPGAQRSFQKALTASRRATSPRVLARMEVLLDSAVEKEPSYASAWAMLADLHVAYRNLGFDVKPSRLELAEEAVSEAFKKRPGWAAAHLASGSVKASQGYWRAALSAFDRAEDAGADPADLGRRRADVYRRQGRTRPARAALEKAVRYFKSAPLAELRAALDADAGSFEEALERLADALESYPGERTLLVRRAAISIAAGRDAGDSLSALSRLLKREEEDVGGLGGVVAEEARGPEEAEKGDPLRLQIAWLALLDGKPELALEHLEGAPPIAYDEHNALPRELLKGWALWQLHRSPNRSFDGARRFLQAESALTGDARAWVALAAVQAELGEREAATASVERALESAPVSADAVLGGGVALTAAAVLEKIGLGERSREVTASLRSAPYGQSPAWVDAHPLRRGPPAGH